MPSFGETLGLPSGQWIPSSLAARFRVNVSRAGSTGDRFLVESARAPTPCGATSEMLTLVKAPAYRGSLAPRWAEAIHGFSGLRPLDRSLQRISTRGHAREP